MLRPCGLRCALDASLQRTADCSRSGPWRGSGMNRRLLFSLGTLAGAGLATLVSQTNVFPGAVAASSETYRQLSLFGNVFDKVRTDYVERPDETKLIEGAINGMLTSLDPHSSYMSPNEFRDMQVETQGEFGGLGRVCKLRAGRGYPGLSPMSGTTRLAEEPANRLRDRTKPGPLQRSRTLQTRPRHRGHDGGGA